MSAAARRLLVAGALLAAAPALAAKKLPAPGERIDLNRATVAELMRLPGLGERKAQAIVARRSRAPFRRPEEVMQVKGLGPAWFRKLKGNLVVGGAPPAGATAQAAAQPAAAQAIPGHLAPRK